MALVPLRAVSQVRQEQAHKIRLVVAGWGPDAEAHRALAHSLRMDGAMTWVGPEMARRVFPAFDVFALSSLYEAMPYVLLEALALGLPVVSSDVGGARLLVQEGQNGFVVPADNELAYAERLRWLVRDAELRTKMGRESQQRVEAFTQARMVASTLQVYEAILEKRSDRDRAAAAEACRGVRA